MVEYYWWQLRHMPESCKALVLTLAIYSGAFLCFMVILDRYKPDLSYDDFLSDEDAGNQDDKF